MLSRQPESVGPGDKRGPGRHRYSFVLAIAAGSAALSLIAPDGMAGRGAAMAAATILFLLMMVAVLDWRRSRDGRHVADRTSAMIANDPEPGIVTDDDNRVVAWNPVARRKFLLAPGEPLSAALSNVFANPHGVLHRLRDDAAERGGAREDIVTRKGHVRISVQALPANQLMWRIEDLPDRSQPGRQAEHLPVAMVTVGRSGAILFMNDAARGLVGGRRKSLGDLFVALPVRPGEINHVRTDHDVSEVLVAEQDAIAGRRELFLFPTAGHVTVQGLSGIEGLPVPVLKLSPAGRVVSLNRPAQTLLGGGAEEGDRLADLMTGLGRPLLDWLKDVSDGRQVNHTEFLRLTRKDREMFVQVTLSRVMEGDQANLVAVLHDATELKTLEAQFVQTQKMQAIGQLAGGVAHDFNNLLTAISGHCDLLLLRHDHGDPDYADLIQIRQNANRAAALVSQLLAFSRKQTLRPQVIDLRDTLADLTHLLNRLVGEKVTLTLTHDPVLKAIRADKRQLEQVLMNLVVNARDAMPAGGEIRIDTEAMTLTEPLRRDRARVPPGDYVVVRVCDEGVGIEPDKLQKVFEPFYTTKRAGEGTGLGLSTAYGIIKQTGGFIFVDSVMGQGTCFSLYLPVHDKPDQEAAPEPVVAAPVIRHGDGVVLLVEDEAPVRAFASRALRLRGYTVLEAESAEDALDLLKDPSVAVDVFVTDVVMPGMDGPSWVRKAMTQRPDVRVVFMSGYAEGAFGDEGPEVPNSTFLPKPFSLNQLTDTVHNQLH